MQGGYDGATPLPKLCTVSDIGLTNTGALGNAITPVRWGLGEREFQVIRDNGKQEPYPERLTY